jgi:serine/threonine protein kinase
MLDMRRHGKSFSTKILKRIGISLLHMHEHGLVHGDFGTHNVGKFGSRWKLLGVGGSKAIGSPTDPKRGFYHPPESVVVETKRAPLGKKEVIAKVVSISAKPSHDIWAFGVLLYEAICGVPLSPYACRGKRAMNANEVAKIGRWDEMSLDRALRHVDPNDQNSLHILRRLLNHNPHQRSNSLREVLELPFFSGSPEDRILKPRPRQSDVGSIHSAHTSTSTIMPRDATSKNVPLSEGLRSLDQENTTNGIPRGVIKNMKVKGSGESVVSQRSNSSAMSQKMKGLKDRVKAGFTSRKQTI